MSKLYQANGTGLDWTVASLDQCNLGILTGAAIQSPGVVRRR